MAQKYIIVKQYIHAIGMHNNSESGYLKCTASKKPRKEIEKEREEMEKRVADYIKVIKDAERKFCETKTAKGKATRYSRLIEAYGWLRRMREFSQKEYVLRYKKIERHEANDLIKAANLIPVIECEDGIIWDTPERLFSKYQGIITIPSNIGF